MWTFPDDITNVPVCFFQDLLYKRDLDPTEQRRCKGQGPDWHQQGSTQVRRLLTFTAVGFMVGLIVILGPSLSYVGLPDLKSLLILKSF